MVDSRCGLLCSKCTYREPCNCGGCIETNGHPFHGECHIAVCCQTKGYSHCGQCPVMPCEQLYNYSCDGGEHSDNPPGARLEILREWTKKENSQLILKVASIIKAANNATIAIIDENGYPRASTISNIKTEGVKTVWFATGLNSGKVKCIKQNNKVGVCYTDGCNNVTLIGTIEILLEAEIKKQLWEDWFINHFPEGVTDSNYCILKFTTKNALLWVDGKYKEIDISN